MLECSLIYGEVFDFKGPSDIFNKNNDNPHILTEENSKNITINYDCTYTMERINPGTLSDNNLDLIKYPFYSNKYDYKPKGEKFFKFTLKKRFYELREDEDKNGEKYKRIQNLKLIFINEEGQEELFLDTSNNKNLTEKIELMEGEIIEYAIVNLKDEILYGLELITNETKICDESYKIGTIKGNNIISIKVKEEKKVIVGLGCYANERIGVTGIYFYFTKIKNIDNIGTFGLRLLRAKAKTNKEFNEIIEKNKKDLDDIQQLTYDISTFPNSVFFTILNYVSSK